ncbi:synaptosomal-associated protein 29-like [Carassius auratus]|uniref:Synaptosomal-associated protein 29 n=1 Tax=Carassius auratus TaxID=7957 RepID=A0A6P6KKM3_CARAU|nr:synaptosomal-associated protein 29-like [Carassius auratus]XP_026072834.1 synaptosomal-associated protein 29-like [Carassius auratus]
MSAYPKSHNPFAADDDDDDEEVSKPRKGFNFDDDPEESSLSPAERRQRQLQQEVMRTAQSAVDSSHRSLGLIYESEKVGAETAEELIRQGEALKRTEKMIDNMEQDMRTSQRHINTIKSVWGGMLNYFKGKPEPPKPAPKEQPVCYEANSRLQNALTESKQQEDKYQASHPNLRKLDTSGFGASASLDNESSDPNGHPKKQLQAAHHQLDRNLDEMSLGLGRLKNLGLGLQAEIDDQDVSLDALLNKVDTMDGKISSTNRQLRNLK